MSIAYLLVEDGGGVLMLGANNLAGEISAPEHKGRNGLDKDVSYSLLRCNCIVRDKVTKITLFSWMIH